MIRDWPSGALALLGLGSLITALDFTIVFVALPDIGSEVGFSTHGLQWVISAYAVCYGGFLLLGGRLSDLVGRRRMFVAGMLLFGVASLLGGLAASPGQLLAARVLQGVGAAALFPATLALVHTLFAAEAEHRRAMAVWATAGAAGLSLGALLGGLLTQAVGWEGVFFVNVPLVVVGTAAAFALLPRDRAPARGGGFDLPGALTATAGSMLLVLALAQAPVDGWTSGPVLGAAVLGLALLAAFGAIEARSAAPLMPLRLLSMPSLRAAMLVILVFGATLHAIPYFLTLYFQLVLGFSALAGGLAFLGPTLAITAGNFVSARLVRRIGTRATLIAGVALGAAGGVVLAAGITADGSYLTVLPGIAVVGLALGVVFPAMFLAASAGIAPREAGTASGMASMALQVGTSAGLAILVGIESAELAGLAGESLRVATAEGLQTVVHVIAASSLLGLLAALALPRPVA